MTSHTMIPYIKVHGGQVGTPRSPWNVSSANPPSMKGIVQPFPLRDAFFLYLVTILGTSWSFPKGFESKNILFCNLLYGRYQILSRPYTKHFYGG